MIDGLFCFDIHGHSPGILARGSRLRGPGTPEDTAIEELPLYGIDACILSAVGDLATFGAETRNELRTAIAQVTAMRSSVETSKGLIVTDSEQLADENQSGVLRTILSVEGLDFLEGDVEVLDVLFGSGVRSVGLMHYTLNKIGGICMDLRGNPGAPGTEGGLTEFGKSLVRRANKLNILIDVAHANERTIREVIEHSSLPIICSHTGPRSLCDSPRYLADSDLLTIARSGGLIGIWPGRVGPSGPVDINALARMIIHTAELCGTDMIALGTDFNGVPAYPVGYRGPVDFAKINEVLISLGLDKRERSGIMGGNARRVIVKALPSARSN